MEYGSEDYFARSSLVKPEARKFLMRITNPDREPASSARHIIESGKQILLILEVPGHGALVMRAETDPAGNNGQLRFVGVSEFTMQEIERGEL